VIQQISPVAHLPLVLGVVRTLNVATLIDTFGPPHPAHVLSCGLGGRPCSGRFWMAIMPSRRPGRAWRNVGCYPCSSPASRAHLSMITGWGRSSMPCRASQPRVWCDRTQGPGGVRHLDTLAPSGYDHAHPVWG
jgi:hypothetical protein